jgi:hypothetical protein
MSPTRSTVSPIYGVKRRKVGANHRRTSKPRLAIPDWYAWSKGYEFPDTPQTPAQARELEKIIQKFVRVHCAKRLVDMPIEMLGNALGLGERQAKTVLGPARKLSHTPEIELTFDVLQGMHSGKIAGVRGTPKTLGNKYMFSKVFYSGTHARLSEIPDGLASAEEAHIMRVWHSAFCIEYREWLRRS